MVTLPVWVLVGIFALGGVRTLGGALGRPLEKVAKPVVRHVVRPALKKPSKLLQRAVWR